MPTRRFLCVVASVLAAALGATHASGCYGGARVEMPDAPSSIVTVPMLVDPALPWRPIVEASVAGLDTPFFLSVDTSVAASWWCEQVPVAAGAPIGFTPNFHGWGPPFRGSVVPGVRVGGLALPRHDWWIFSAEEPLWRDVCGALSGDVFRNVDVVLDYAEGTVSFHHAKTAPARGSAVALRFRGYGLPQAAVSFPGGRTALLVVDTASPETIVSGRAAGLPGHPTRRRTRNWSTTLVAGEIGWESRTHAVVAVETLHLVGAKLGEATLPPFEAVLRGDPYDEDSHASWDGGDGVLGADVLRHFRVTISIARKKMWLEPRTAPLAPRKTVRERKVEVARDLLRGDPKNAAANLFLGDDLPLMLHGPEAESALARVAERYPAEGGHGLRHARIAAFRGDFDEALARARATSVDAGAHGPAQLLEAELLLWKGDLAGAIARADELIRAGGGTGNWNHLWVPAPRKPWVLEAAYTVKALAMYLRGEVAEALPVAREGVTSVGDYLPARWLVGRIWLARGEPGFAADQFEFLLDAGGAPYDEVFDAYASFGRLADLELVLTKLRDLEAKEGWSGGWERALAAYYRELDRPEQAAAAAARALATEPYSFDERVSHALAFADLGRFDETLARLEAIRRDHPLRESAVFAVEAEVLGAAGRYADALAAAERALKIWPREDRASRAMLLPLDRLGRHEERLAVLRRLAEAHDHQRAEWVRTLRALGRDADAAPIAPALLAHDRVALALDPRSAAARAGLALHLAWSGGDPSEARRLAEEAVTTRPRALEPLLALAEVLQAAGDAGGAHAAADRALALEPWNESARRFASR